MHINKKKLTQNKQQKSSCIHIYCTLGFCDRATYPFYLTLAGFQPAKNGCIVNSEWYVVNIVMFGIKLNHF